MEYLQEYIDPMFDPDPWIPRNEILLAMN